MQDVRVGVGVRGDFQAAIALLDDAQYSEATRLLRTVTEAAPQLAAAHINLAMAYGKLENWELAEASAGRAIELSPRHPVAHNELGMIRRRQGRFDEARASYETALDIASDFHFARRNLAILCDLFTADVQCALEHYEIYAEAVPSDDQVGIWVADLRKRAGNTHAGER